MNTYKICKGCNVLLPLYFFYKHRRMLDGHLSFCKDCVKERVRLHRVAHIEQINAYDRERGKQPKRKKQLRLLCKHGQLNRGAVYNITSNAIRDGKLIRPDACSACGKQCKPEAHHDDYSNPLNVRWLCRSCHCRHHRLQYLAARQLETAS